MLICSLHRYLAKLFALENSFTDAKTHAIILLVEIKRLVGLRKGFLLVPGPVTALAIRCGVEALLMAGEKKEVEEFRVWGKDNLSAKWPAVSASGCVVIGSGADRVLLIVGNGYQVGGIGS